MCHCEPWAETRPPTTTPQALVIESESLLREAVAAALRLAGFEVSLADTLERAFVLLPYVKPTLVLGSVARHHLGAVAALCPRAVRVVLTDIKPGPSVPTGADIALVKPFGAAELMRAIDVAKHLVGLPQAAAG